jgi:hypothetical protein
MIGGWRGHEVISLASLIVRGISSAPACPMLYHELSRGVTPSAAGLARAAGGGESLMRSENVTRSASTSVPFNICSAEMCTTLCLALINNFTFTRR